MSRNALGRVLGSREVGVLEFWVGVEPGQYLRLDDLVVVEFPHPDPAQGTLRYYGMVDQVVKLHEGSQFDTDIFLVSQELLPASLAYAARVRVTRLEPEEYLPPDPGSLVYRAEGEDLERALYYDRMRDARRGVDLRLPAGLLRTGKKEKNPPKKIPQRRNPQEKQKQEVTNRKRQEKIK
jgi:DNA helicase HerA-like ATPase